MANIPCFLSDLSVTTIYNGSKLLCRVNGFGDDTGEAQTTICDEANNRYYDCENCNQKFDGRDTFTLAREHLGEIHEKIPAGLAILNQR
jgi:hypothetical protein